MNSKDKRLPEWIKGKTGTSEKIHELKSSLRRFGIHTVCEEARCPNIGECFSRKTATFMIMGNICTRNCGFCAVKHGEPNKLDLEEPKHVADQALKLALKHVVVTSVTRDDLHDSGANHFSSTIISLKEALPKSSVEVLTPDFLGKETLIKIVCKAMPSIFNHNIETVERLTPMVRSKAEYKRSLKVVEIAKTNMCDGMVKSGLMLGLGEKLSEVIKTLRDLKNSGCDIVTIGQYLSPSKTALPVKYYYKPEDFDDLKKYAEEIGFEKVFAGPLVRSSYMAENFL